MKIVSYKDFKLTNICNCSCKAEGSLFGTPPKPSSEPTLLLPSFGFTSASLVQFGREVGELDVLAGHVEVEWFAGDGLE